MSALESTSVAMNYKFVLLDSATRRARAHWIKSPPVTIGRDPSCQILINDPSISRRHCQFTVDAEGSLIVRDLGSKNGVYVEQRRVDKKVVVRPGMIVQIGAVSLRPEWTEQAALEGTETIELIDQGETQRVRIIDADSALGD